MHVIVLMASDGGDDVFLVGAFTDNIWNATDIVIIVTVTKINLAISHGSKFSVGTTLSTE